MKTHGEQEAYPVHGGEPDGTDDPRNKVLRGGMTKREEFSSRNLAGMLSNTEIRGMSLYDFQELAKNAVRQADALIEALNKD